MWHCSYPRVFFRLLNLLLRGQPPLPLHHSEPLTHPPPHVTGLNRPLQCFSSPSPNVRLRSCHITHKGVFQSGALLGSFLTCFLAGCGEFAGVFLGGEKSCQIYNNKMFCSVTLVWYSTLHTGILCSLDTQPTFKRHTPNLSCRVAHSTIQWHKGGTFSSSITTCYRSTLCSFHLSQEHGLSHKYVCCQRNKCPW